MYIEKIKIIGSTDIVVQVRRLKKNITKKEKKENVLTLFFSFVGLLIVFTESINNKESKKPFKSLNFKDV